MTLLSRSFKSVKAKNEGGVVVVVGVETREKEAAFSIFLCCRAVS